MAVASKYLRLNEIPVDKLVRAYELNAITDLNYKEIARALEVDYDKLLSAIYRTEKNGLYGTYMYGGPVRAVAEYLEKTNSNLTPAELAKDLKLNEKSVKYALKKGLDKGFLKKLNSGEYYYNDRYVARIDL